MTAEQSETAPRTHGKKLGLRYVAHVVTMYDPEFNGVDIDFVSTGDFDDDMKKAGEIAAENGWTELIDWDAGVEDLT